MNQLNRLTRITQMVQSNQSTQYIVDLFRIIFNFVELFQKIFDFVDLYGILNQFNWFNHASQSLKAKRLNHLLYENKLTKSSINSLGKGTESIQSILQKKNESIQINQINQVDWHTSLVRTKAIRPDRTRPDSSRYNGPYRVASHCRRRRRRQREIDGSTARHPPLPSPWQQVRVTAAGRGERGWWGGGDHAGGRWAVPWRDVRE